MIKKLNFKVFLEITSGIAGVAFALSGIYNFFLFQSYFDLNYFAIASPTDVVMSAFLLFMLIFGILAGIALILVVFYLSISLFEKAQKFLKVVGVLLLSCLIGVPIVAQLIYGEWTFERWFRDSFYLVDYQVVGGAPKGCQDAQLRWIGERSTIYECGDTNIMVVQNSENVIFRPRSEQFHD